MAHTGLILTAFILALLAAFGIGHPRFALGWAALAAYMLSLLV